jgi:hypothetical protein
MPLEEVLMMRNFAAEERTPLAKILDRDCRRV